MNIFTSIVAVVIFAGSAFAQQLVAGVYKISSASATNSVLTSPFGNTIQVLPNDNSTNQLWALSPVPGLGNGNWTIQNVGTGQFAVAPGFPVIGTTIVSSPSSFNWFTRPDGSAWRIHVTISLAATFVDTSVTGVSLRSTSSITGDTQAWNFDLVGPITPGTYNIVNTASNTFLDSCFCSAGSAIPLVSIAANGAASQKWIVSSVPGGFTIKNAATGAFAVAPGQPVIGTTVVTDATASAFTWNIAKQGSLFTIATGTLGVSIDFPNIEGAATSLKVLSNPAAGSQLFNFVAV